MEHRALSGATAAAIETWLAARPKDAAGPHLVDLGCGDLALLAPLLRRLTDAEWTKEGRHTHSGRYTAEDWLRIYAAHLEGHVQQIERNVEAWTASSSSR
jgi:hypothetical protein